jgi:hypothetical protein
MAIVLRLGRLFIGCCLDEFITNCFVVFEGIFVEDFELVAFFNFVKNSLFINFGLFDNGIYVP